MTLLLLLSAMLSALTGVGGSARIDRTPVVTAQAAATIVAEVGERLSAPRFVAEVATVAARVIDGNPFVLAASVPTYQDCRRE